MSFRSNKSTKAVKPKVSTAKPVVVNRGNQDKLNSLGRHIFSKLSKSSIFTKSKKLLYTSIVNSLQSAVSNLTDFKGNNYFKMAEALLDQMPTKEQDSQELYYLLLHLHKEWLAKNKNSLNSQAMLNKKQRRQIKKLIRSISEYIHGASGRFPYYIFPSLNFVQQTLEFVHGNMPDNPFWNYEKTWSDREQVEYKSYVNYIVVFLIKNNHWNGYSNVQQQDIDHKFYISELLTAGRSHALKKRTPSQSSNANNKSNTSKDKAKNKTIEADSVMEVVIEDIESTGLYDLETQLCSNCHFCKKELTLSVSTIDKFKKLAINKNLHCPFCLRQRFDARTHDEILKFDFFAIIDSMYDDKTIELNIVRNRIQDYIDEGELNPVFTYDADTCNWYLDLSRIGNFESQLPLADVLSTCKKMIDALNPKNDTKGVNNSEYLQNYSNLIKNAIDNYSNSLSIILF